MDARMFNGGNPDLALCAECFGEMVRDHVVRLGRAAGPDEVERMAAEQRGKFFTRVGERNGCARAGLVHGRRIAAVFSVTSSQASRASRITGAVAL